MSLLISIDRTALGLSPLVLSGVNDGSKLGVSNYVEPAMQPRIQYAPASSYIHGDVALAWSWQQSVLGFDWFPDAADEAEARSLHAALVVAVTQGLEYLVTVTVGNAPAETWRCNPGTVVAADGRTYTDLRDSNPVWSVSLPCYPVRS